MTHDTIYSRFRKKVNEQPDAVAVKEESREVTYSQLDAMADSIYFKFACRGYKRIGIVMTHSIEMIAAMLAVVKSGAAYVPAEPSLPEKRRRYMMDAAGVGLVIDDEYCSNLERVKVVLTDHSRPDGEAYVLFTSGTTGKPKGVVVENHSVVNYADAFEEEFHTGMGDVMLQYSVCSFDIFVEEVFTTLLNGATLAITPAYLLNGGAAMTRELMDFAGRMGVTIISGFPYLLAELDKLPSLPSTIRLLISGGDVLRESYIHNLRKSGVVIYNTYGPSETTVCATYQRCDNIDPLPDGTYPIGHPIKGVSVRIVDEMMNEVPAGVSGEICIEGEGVSLGYIGNPPEQANFVTGSDGKRMYRSGDMGYILADGSLAFLHRNDDQVMILGKRVEPAEVENVLCSSPEVDRCVVRPFSDDMGLSYLVAYFVPKHRQFSLKAIKQYLSTRLTDFMVPEFFIALKNIPVNKRGKIDVSALPVVLKDGSNDI